MNYYDLVQWQLVDPSNNLVFPWFTHPFLEELKSWELEGKSVLEWGSGKGTLWWAQKTDRIVAVETDRGWWADVTGWLLEFKLDRNAAVYWTACSEGEQDLLKRIGYITAADNFSGCYDIIVVDGILRYECMQEGIELLQDNPGGGKLIVDNWDQDGFLCPACVELVSSYEGHIYPQPGHTDHHGNCWKTAYFVIPAK